MKRNLIGIVCFIKLFIVALSPTLAQQLIERPVVRLIYFVPRDRAPQPNINADLDRMIKEVQQHYANSMEWQQHGKKSFKIETDPNGNAVVDRMTGKLNTAGYSKRSLALFDQIKEEIGQRYNITRNIYLVVADTGQNFIAHGSSRGSSGAGGIALIPARSFDNGSSFRTAAHVLGHAFGLANDFYDRNLMYHVGGSYVSRWEAEWLDVHRAFNRSRPAANTRTRFEMLRPRSAPQPYAIRLRFKVTDPDGLHQVQLLTKTLAGPASGQPEFLHYNSVKGNSTTFEFVTTRLIPKSKVFLSAIDVNGNFDRSQAFPLDITQLLPPARAVSIPDANLAAAIRREIGNSITTHTLLKLTRLEADNRDIKNLKGLEHTHNLYELNLSNNAITDLSPLINLTNLYKLSLSHNVISDVSPLTKLTQLEYLWLRDNAISDISPLEKLAHLSGLDLTDNNVSDISPLVRLNLSPQVWSNLSGEDGNRTGLYISGNPLNRASVEKHIPALQARGIVVEVDSPAHEVDSPAHIKILQEPPRDVSIPDANLAAAIRDIIGSSITTHTLLKLKRLNAPKRGIRNLRGLEHAHNLETLDLRDNNITGISPLLGLNLSGTEEDNTGLDIRGNPLNRASVEKHIPALQARGIVVEVDSPAHIKILREPPRNVSIPDANLAAAIRDIIGSSITTHTLLKLIQLDASERGIRNLGGLEHAHNLEYLELQDTNISDISSLANLTKLTELTLSNNNISDISSLANLTKLETLWLQDTNIRDISVLANLTKLTELGFRLSDTTDVSPLANLTNLKSLYLLGNGITDVSPLTNLTNLKLLEIQGNGITDVSPLTNLTNLKSLYLGANNITDVSPLANLTQLKDLDLGQNDITDVSPLANLTQLEYLDLSWNNITDIAPLLGLNFSGKDWDHEGRYILTDNPLNRVSVEKHIPALQAKGITVSFDNPAQAAPVLLPKETLLLTNYPNPFNPETWIPYQLAQPAEVTLRIYTSNGALVRALDLGHQPAGNYQSKGRAAYWDGRNELGERAASGLYFYNLTAGEFTATRKMLIRK